MTILPFPLAGQAQGPNGIILGPTDTIVGPSGSEHGQKRTQLYCVYQQRQWDLAWHPSEAPGPVSGVLGPFWGFFPKCLNPARFQKIAICREIWLKPRTTVTEQKLRICVPVPTSPYSSQNSPLASSYGPMGPAGPLAACCLLLLLLAACCCCC